MPQGSPDTEALLRLQVRPLLKNAAMVSLRHRLESRGPTDESAVVCPWWWVIRRCTSPCVKQFCSLRTPYSKHNQMISTRSTNATRITSHRGTAAPASPALAEERSNGVTSP